MPAPRPSDLGLRRAAVAQPLCRAVLAHARASYHPHRSAELIARQLFPRDEATMRIINRAASAPAMTTTAGWAPELGQNIISDLLVSLGPASAASEVLRRATVLTLDRFASVTVPSLVASASNASFVGEGATIPFRQLDTSKSVKLSPHKLATAFGLSREIIESSNAEALIGLVLKNSISLTLDSVFFGSAAGTAAQPPGLLYGITPLGAAPGGGSNAFVTDIAALTATCAAVGGLDLVFVASPPEAVKILLTAGPRFTFPIFASGALAAKTVICLAPVAVVAAVDPNPEIEEGRHAISQMDTAPAADPMTATPTRSFFQTDSSGFRLTLDATWGLLNPAGASIVSGVTW
jgi:hypothetical protein